MSKNVNVFDPVLRSYFKKYYDKNERKRGKKSINKNIIN